MHVCAFSCTFQLKYCSLAGVPPPQRFHSHLGFLPKSLNVSSCFFASSIVLAGTLPGTNSHLCFGGMKMERLETRRDAGCEENKFDGMSSLVAHCNVFQYIAHAFLPYRIVSHTDSFIASLRNCAHLATSQMAAPAFKMVLMKQRMDLIQTALAYAHGNKEDEDYLQAVADADKAFTKDMRKLAKAERAGKALTKEECIRMRTVSNASVCVQMYVNVCASKCIVSTKCI